MRAILVGLAVLIAACGADDTGPGPAPDTFPAAVQIEVDESFDGTAEPGEPVIFLFSAQAGDWLQLSLTADADFEWLTLRDRDGEMLAFAPSRYPTHIAVTGWYYVETALYVDDKIPSPPSAPYTFRVGRLSDGEDTAIDAEPNDDADAAQSLHPAYDDEVTRVYGVFDDADDVDVYRFHVEAETNEVYPEFWLSDNSTSHGSTSDVGSSWITDVDGTTVVGRSEPENGERAAYPLAGPADYLLWIDRGDSTPGSNDFYDLDLLMLRQPFFEQEAMDASGGNDTMALADALPGEGADVYYLYLFLPPGDVDYAYFDVTYDHTMIMNCDQMDGSGLLDDSLTAELRDSSDTVLESVISNTPNPFDATVGRFYLRLEATGHDPEVDGYFVRCQYRL